jgi:hypothetical protein
VIAGRGILTTRTLLGDSIGLRACRRDAGLQRESEDVDEGRLLRRMPFWKYMEMSGN